MVRMFLNSMAQLYSQTLMSTKTDRRRLIKKAKRAMATLEKQQTFTAQMGKSVESNILFVHFTNSGLYGKGARKKTNIFIKMQCILFWSRVKNIFAYIQMLCVEDLTLQITLNSPCPIVRRGGGSLSVGIHLSKVIGKLYTVDRKVNRAKYTMKLGKKKQQSLRLGWRLRVK